MIPIDLIKELRERTHVSIGICKQALEAAGKDVAKAVDWLRVRGELRVQDLTGRATNSGAVISYIHPGNQLGVLLKVSCESDFVARGDDFKAFCKDVAMHIAAANPLFVSASEAPGTPWYNKESDIILDTLKEDPKMKDKPVEMMDKVIKGKLAKMVSQVSLLEQPFVKDPTKTIGTLLAELVLKTGEKVEIKSFSRLSLKE